MPFSFDTGMKKTAHKPCSQPTRCAIYARTATVKQASEENSIAQQVATCECFAKRKGWIVREECVFTDSGKSGLRANLGLKDLLCIAAARPKSFDVLLCTAIDRIARDTGLVIKVHTALKKHGVEIRFAETGLPQHQTRVSPDTKEIRPTPSPCIDSHEGLIDQ